MAANEGLEKAINRVRQDQRLNIPSEGHESNPSPQL